MPRNVKIEELALGQKIRMGWVELTLVRYEPSEPGQPARATFSWADKHGDQHETTVVDQFPDNLRAFQAIWDAANAG
jgi:hypothetical protein